MSEPLISDLVAALAVEEYQDYIGPHLDCMKAALKRAGFEQMHMAIRMTLKHLREEGYAEDHPLVMANREAEKRARGEQ